MFRSLFKRKTIERAPEIENLTIGRTFSIDPVELKLVGKDALFVPPETDMKVVAQGFCDLGEQSYLHRMYPDDDRFLLQFQGGDGIDDTRIDEIVIWYAFDVQYISQDHEWRKAEQRIRASYFDLSSDSTLVRYQRVWFDHSDADEDPMTYFEDVREKRDDKAEARIFQTAMLFGRGLEDGSDEMLLVNMEEPKDGDRVVSYLVGRLIPRHSLVT